MKTQQLVFQNVLQANDSNHQPSSTFFIHQNKQMARGKPPTSLTINRIYEEKRTTQP